MGSGLTYKSTTSRLELAKTAIKLSLDKLRPDDFFSLVIFNNEAKTIFPLTKVELLNKKEAVTKIDSIQTNGGTTILSGFKEAEKNITIETESI